MQTRTLASVNIQRDLDREINYIPTPNARMIADLISNDFKRGVRSFNIIGSYGTGKSSFMLAYEKTLMGKAKIFDVNILTDATVDFINIIGEYSSIQELFASEFDVIENKNSKNIFSEIFNRYYDLTKKAKNAVLFLVVDEFGKFLEYASKNNPERELYFIQKLSEFVGNSDNNIVLITISHQNTEAYANELNSLQKQEWTKIKGRFRELAFNEPVEQLLFLASEQLGESYPVPKSAQTKLVTELFLNTKAFRYNYDLTSNIATRLYPIDLFAAYTLTSSIQRYGQNERSLFSFLQSTDTTSIDHHQKNNVGFYSLSNVYDYLTYNFYFYIHSLGNPDLSFWKAIKNALEKVERIYEQDIIAYSAVIKTVGLLNLFAENGARLNKDFLVNYTKMVLGYDAAENLIADLESSNIIAFRNYSNRYVFSEGTDVDIPSELLKASNKVNQVTDITTLLNKHYQLPPIVAKEVTYVTGTPRLFEYIISESPVSIQPKGEIDGFINLIFSNNFPLEKVLEISAQGQEAVLYGYYKNTGTIKDLLFEIEKTKKVIEENVDDKVAVRELNNIMQHQQNFLNHKILNNFYNQEREVVWIYNGQRRQINSKKSFNSLLSEICNHVYHQTPRFINELINKHKLSGSIHGAKRNYLRALVESWNLRSMGFPEDRYPPEKTIAAALLTDNGILLYQDLDDQIFVNDRNNFQHVWNVSMDFLNSARVSKRRISELAETLLQRPFKLKQGLIDFWIPTFLFIKRNDFALFNEEKYIANLNSEILELVIKDAAEYEIKTFDVEGVRLNLFNSYRTFLQLANEEAPGGTSFIETIKPFLTFYRNLPDYSKNTRRISKEAIAVREVIAKSKDPEQTFFEAFPTALGYTINQLQENEKELQQYTIKLQENIRELRNSYSELIERFELFILEEILGQVTTFENYKKKLQARYGSIKKHLLISKQKTFIQRLDSSIDDKVAWLNSIAQSIVGNSLDKLTDNEELKLYDQFKMMILELDSLTNLSKSNLSDDKNELMSLEINSFETGMSKKTLRLPKNKTDRVAKVEDELRKTLSNDATIDMAALASLLKELMVK